MTNAEKERVKLLFQLITFGPQQVETTFAERELFPDTTLEQWCRTHDIKVHSETVGSGRRSDGRSNVYAFYCFEMIDDEEW